MKKHLIILLVLLPVALFAGIYGGGGGPNAWYQIPHSAREISMGRTGIASANLASAFVWNPALSYEVERYCVQSALPASTESDRMSFRRGAHDQSWSGWAVAEGSMISQRLSGWHLGTHVRHWLAHDVARTSLDVTDQIVVEELMRVKSMLFELNGAYSVRSVNRQRMFAVGVNVRGASQWYPSKGVMDSYWIKGFDLGVIAQMYRNLKLGAVYRADHYHSDATGTIWQSTFGAGICSNFRLPSISRIMTIQLASDATVGNYSPGVITFGSELQFASSLGEYFVRTGVASVVTRNPNGKYELPPGDDSRKLNNWGLGLGARWSGFHVDIAYEWKPQNYYASFINPNIYLSIAWAPAERR